MVEIGANLKGDLAGDLARFEARINQEVLLSGVAAMAKPIYEQAIANAPTLGRESYFYGENKRYLLPVDALKKAIYRVYSPENSTGSRKVYRISWNHRKAPHGFMVEYGTSHSRARPFLRPAFHSRIQAAIDAGNDRMKARLSESGSAVTVSGE